MKRFVRRLIGLVLLAAAAVPTIAFAKAEYGPLALICFCIALSIGSAGLYLLIAPCGESNNRDYVHRRF